MNDHLSSVEEVFIRFNTGRNGIDAGRAEQLLQKFGYNRLTEFKKKTVLQLLFRQFTDFMILILLGAALFSAIAGDGADTIIILVIVLLNAVIGFVQEFRAEKAMEALRKMAVTQAVIVRNGFPVTVSSELLVPGDLVILEAGNSVPADIRLTETFSFRTDEASLTGESQPVEKTPAQLFADPLPLGERSNMAYKGTFVTYGRAKGIVVATGMETEFGKIAALFQQEEVKTPLQKRLTDFGKWLSLLILLLCACIFLVGYLQKEDVMLMLFTSVSLAVAAIPEALPAVITVTLALGARKMIKYNALIRNLPAVETLGSVTYICTDKTGTLTENKMKVQELFNGKSNYKKAELTRKPADDSLKLLLTAMAVNNDVSLAENGTALGEPTELALFQLAFDCGFNKAEVERQMPRTAEIPFDADRKRMSTIHTVETEVFVFVKGAPDALLSESTLTTVEKEAWTAESDRMAAEGLRVLGFAMKRIRSLPSSLDSGEVENNLIMLGFAGLMDPPRDEVKQAIQECKTAGIVPVMITGDHFLTAKAIAMQLGIIETDTDLIISGHELADLSQQQLSETVEKIKVYARVSPEQKLIIIKALQQRGQFVAMTGDGVNDAPSLKMANIGIAMGITGTDVSKEAADMILTDDNFTTIVKAVKEGRRVYDNIRKFIRFIMSGNSGEIWTILLAPFFGLPLPLLPVHILYVNLMTDGLPALAIASERAESGIMKRPPRHPEESIFANGLGIHVLWVGFLIGLVCVTTQAIACYSGAAHWQTMVFTVLCFSQLGHVFSIRSEREFLYKQGIFGNRPLIVTVLISLTLQLAIIYVPFFNTVFKTAPLTFVELVLTLLVSLIVFHAVELEKYLKRRFTAKMEG